MNGHVIISPPQRGELSCKSSIPKPLVRKYLKFPPKHVEIDRMEKWGGKKGNKFAIEMVGRLGGNMRAATG